MTDEERIAELLEAYQAGHADGGSVDLEALCREHPHLLDELRLRVHALDLIEQAYHEDRMVPASAPTRLGDYEIRREIGRGGMGVVYEAYQQGMQREVALKVLFPSVTGSKRAIERFQREARAAGRVQHTNLVPVYTMGQIDGAWFYAMELVDGVSLATVLRGMRERAPVSEGSTAGLSDTPGTQEYGRDVARLFAGAADALQAAHDEGILHRDVKPSNLILDAKGVLKIIDFGVARIGDEASDVTTTGELLGTPAYMSPEQARGRPGDVDGRADIYSLGATLYEALTLRPPFQGKSYGEVYEQLVSSEPLPPRQLDPRIARDLETVVLKAIEKDPARRYQSAGELARDLRAFADGAAIGARRVTFVERLWRRAKRHKALTAVTTCLVLALLVAGALGLQAREEEDKRRQTQYDLLVQEAAVALSAAEEQQQDAGAGEALFAQAVRLAPERPEAYVGLALMEGRDVEQRLADLAVAEARGLPAAGAARLRAVLLHEAGRSEEARQAEAGLARAPVPASPLHALALGLRAAQLEDVDRAVAHLTTAVVTSPTPSLYGYLARRARAPLLARQGRLREALDDLHATRARGERGADRTLLTAALWRRLGEEGKAESLLAESLADDIATMADWHAMLEAMHFMRGRQLDAQGKADAALTALRRAVAVPGSSENTRMLLVKVLLREGHHEEAIAVLEQAMIDWPEHGRPPMWRGLVHLELERDDAEARVRAEALARRAMPLQNSGSLAHLVLALAMHRQGRHREALDALLPIANAGRAEFMAVSIAVLAHCALGEIAEARARLASSIAGVHASDKRWQSEVERRLRYEALAALEAAERAARKK